MREVRDVPRPVVERAHLVDHLPVHAAARPAELGVGRRERRLDPRRARRAAEAVRAREVRALVHVQRRAQEAVRRRDGRGAVERHGRVREPALLDRVPRAARRPEPVGLPHVEREERLERRVAPVRERPVERPVRRGRCGAIACTFFEPRWRHVLGEEAEPVVQPVGVAPRAVVEVERDEVVHRQVLRAVRPSPLEPTSIIVLIASKSRRGRPVSGRRPPPPATHHRRPGRRALAARAVAAAVAHAHLVVAERRGRPASCTRRRRARPTPARAARDGRARARAVRESRRPTPSSLARAQPRRRRNSRGAPVRLDEQLAARERVVDAADAGACRCVVRDGPMTRRRRGGGSSVAAAGRRRAAASTIAAPPAAATAGGGRGRGVRRIDTPAEHPSTTSATGLSTPHELRRPSEPHWGVSTSSADAQGDADSDS